MFHTLITLAYTIPGLYLFLRIWSLFIEKRHRLAYILIFAVIYSLYPLSNLADDGGWIIAGALETISNYLLPFFLYVFLFTQLTDLLLLVNLAIKVVPKERLSDRRFRYRWLAAIMACSVTIVVYGIINFNSVSVTGFTVSVPKRGAEAGTFRIVFASDLHLAENVPARFVRRFVEKSNRLRPDVVLLGGDIVEGGRMGERMAELEEILRGLSPRYGVYGVLGNHDGYGRGNVEGFFSGSGINILRDTAVVIGSSFVVAGRNDSRVRGRKTAGEIIASVTAGLPVILLDHRPTDYDAIGRTRADIVMSGHTHHGQLFPINLITGSIYELSYGYLRKGTTNFFVSSGLRLWGPPVRTTAKSEIMVVDVELE